MSDQITEDYQEQVLVDLSEIKDSVTTDSGYEEKVLDDLHDIKESVSEEQEYYDKEYQKKVLGNLRSLQKSVEALNVNYVEISPNSFTKDYTVGYSSGNLNKWNLKGYYYRFDLTDLTDVYLTVNDVTVSPDTNPYKIKYFFCNYSDFDGYPNGTAVNIYGYTVLSSSINKELLNQFYNQKYLFVVGSKNPDCHLYYIDENSGDSGEVTSGSAVMVDGIDTLIQITTFQGFASALLTGILLFLLFVKGLRR